MKPPRSTVFARAHWAAILAFLFAAGSMLAYPGGTHLETTSRRYSLTQNFLSDLGTTVAFNGERNLLGATLFVLSLGVLVMGLGAALVDMVRVYSTDRTRRVFARGAAVLGLLTCAAFAGVALTPADRGMALHLQFTLLAFRTFPLAALLLAAATWKHPRLPAIVSVLWLLLAVALGSYVGIMEWGPRASTVEGLTVQVIAQKVITAFAVLVIAYQSHASSTTT